MQDYDIRYANFEGPSEEQEDKARNAYFHQRGRAAQQRQMQSSGPKYIGTPRHAKHRGNSVNGVRMR